MTRHLRLGALPMLIALGVTLVAAPAGAQSVVTTDKGDVVGVDTPTVHTYLGIPYAAPPVGALRWTPPQPAAPWATPRDASAFANHCPQVFSPYGRPTDTEDCLYLNVFVPNQKGFPHDVRRHRPVMVWIHGGALVVGESDDYDPARLATQGDVVVVTINYRLGILGFLAHPALTAESPDHSSGNYGLRDQQAALAWVQRNIRAFGGNPRKVTIFGESAGGLSVLSQITSPLATGLFARAIIESGAYLLTPPPLADGETAGTAFATTAGCADQSASCLRALTVDQILAAQPTDETSTKPYVDGTVLPQGYEDALVSGHYNKVPVIEGTNHDEFRLFIGQAEVQSGMPLTAAGYPDAIAALLNVPASLTPLFVSHYPITGPGAFPNPSEALAAMATDAAFACNAHTLAPLFSRFAHAYIYEFNDENAPEVLLPPVSFPYGAAHASEIPYLFDVVETYPATFTADQQQLASAMVKYWTSFARHGKPAAPHAPKWKPYNLLTDNVFSLVPPPQTLGPESGFPTDHQCAFWTSLGV